jgi:hypothetical protein
VGGVVLGRWRERLVGWATAIAGAGLVLAGVGRVDPGVRVLSEPNDAGEQGVAVVAWVVLAIVARLVQRRISRSHGRPPS